MTRGGGSGRRLDSSGHAVKKALIHYIFDKQIR